MAVWYEYLFSFIPDVIECAPVVCAHPFAIVSLMGIKRIWRISFGSIVFNARGSNIVNEM